MIKVVGNFQKNSQLAHWVSGGQFGYKITKKSQFAPWVLPPLPPVSSSSQGSRNDPIKVDNLSDEEEGDGGEEVEREQTPYPGVLIPVEVDRAEDAP